MNRRSAQPREARGGAAREALLDVAAAVDSWSIEHARVVLEGGRIEFNTQHRTACSAI